ncbi:unnamed protein product [Lupinus luteus]|uniref:Uncharacterized protein n=1 Tax=Lupinus luteus TaxID=3873 RepID=A0AAV1WQE9_LUPLU
MVAVFNKELLSWYLITLKIKETLQLGVPSAPSSGMLSTEFPEQQKLQQEPSESLHITISEGGEHSQEGATSPESEWMISTKEKLEQACQDDEACSWDKLSIYQIPHYLRDSSSDDKAYVPQIVSLGPYHHGKRRLREMERHKWRSLNHVLKRTNHDIRLYLDAMNAIKERAISCYEGSISLISNEFVEMLVLDGCFVLELFRGATEGFAPLGYSRNDPVFAMRGLMHSIQRDMIMLENQLPLFVLDHLLGIQLGNPDLKGLVADLALRFFDPLMPTDEPLTKKNRNKAESSEKNKTTTTTATCDPLSDEDGLHCLDVFRRSLLRRGTVRPPSNWTKRWSNAHRVADKRQQQLIHSVSSLREAGIKFRKRKTDRFWDIKFKDGILRIPRLLIHDGTKSLFFNLIAFEQCHLECSNDFTSYVIFMDNLINSPADVGYLHYHGIIEHWLGNDAEVAELFNRLCREVVFDINDSYFCPLSEVVNRYYNHRWSTWCASLRHNYFNNPWAIISSIAAVVLLLFTLAQTFYSIYGYYRPL